MASSRKKLLDNVTKFPVHQEPQLVHFEKAKKIRPTGILNRKELQVWDRVAPVLAMLGRLKPHFVDSVSQYCIILTRLIETKKYLDKNGWYYETQGGRNGDLQKARPQVSQMNEDWRKWRSLLGEFGLAPGSDIGIPSNDNKTDDFDGF